MKIKSKIYILIFFTIFGFYLLIPNFSSNASVYTNDKVKIGLFSPEDVSIDEQQVSQVESSSTASQTEILRPNENIQNDWGVSDFSNIDDDGGDGEYNAHAGNYESVTDIFNMETVDYNINPEESITIKIFLYCECFVFHGGIARISVSYRFGNEGSWSSSKSVSSPFPMAWKTFSWTDIGVLKPDMNNLQIRLIGYIDASGIGGGIMVDAMYAEISYTAGEKIAVFFHNTDVVFSSAIDTYETIARYRGYTKIFRFPDVSYYSFSSKISEVDSYEKNYDKVFFYFGCHGGYLSGVSYLALKKGDSTGTSSIYVKSKLNYLETDIIGILVDACQAGEFATRFNEPYYLIMTSTDTTHSTFKWRWENSFWFSNDFWISILYGSNAVEAWTSAAINTWLRPFWWWQYPQMNDNSIYVFFGD
ncbi:MAG: hypothetical protein ACFFD2_21125 [Promethearchaeota archaeon]